MKLYAILSLILFLTMLFMPLFSLLGSTAQSVNAPVMTALSTQNTPKPQAEASSEQTTEVRTEKTTAANDGKIETDGDIAVLRVSSGKIENVGITDYVIGCVACEMPASYELEALKAQAVVSFTYALYQRSEGERSDLSDDPSVHQAYASYDELKEKWGDSYDKNIAVIKKAVKAVSGEYLTYEKKLIKPPYFALSSGMTNSAEDVWGNEVSWLVSVSSDGDKLSPSVKSIFEFTEDEIIELLKDKCELKEISISKPVKAKSGYVKSIDISSHKFSGEELRRLLSLRSGNFTVKKEGDLYVFTCMGYGHGVGMSQNGANYMAKQGSGYREILSHYYPGTEVLLS